ncbi:MAG: hypothetical protein GY774_03270 [Planctomycetes bacterium]|nr:hypothetical protein [Planctomycetota bacterium]
MKISENELNSKEFNIATHNKWKNEPLEFFKCSNCSLIIVGIPDCHIALSDPSNLNTKIKYNLPRRISCPKCRAVWYDGHQIKKYKVEDVTVEELLSSGWGNIFTKEIL